MWGYQCRRNMTALKKTVRTRRGVEPAGRPARRVVGRGRRARTNSSRTFAQRAGRPRSRAARPGGATVVAPAQVAMRSDGRIVGRRRRAVVVVNQSSFEIRPISNGQRGEKVEGGEVNRRRTAAPSARRHVPPGVLVVLERLLGREKQPVRSAIFLIRKGAWRPPAGSAAPARRKRARGLWGTY